MSQKRYSYDVLAFGALTVPTPTGHEAQERALAMAIDLANAPESGEWVPEGMPPETSVDVPAKLRARIVTMLDGFLRHQKVTIEVAGASGTPVTFDLVRDRARGDAAIQSMRGPVRAILVLGVGFALLSELGAQLRRCPAPLAGRADEACERFFLRTGRMEYCSPRCQRRAYMRQYRPKTTSGRRKR